MTDSELFASFLKKYKIKNYSLERNKNQKYVIFNKEDNYYYKIFIRNIPFTAKFNDLHYFLNNAHFPNTLVSSITDTELGIWIIKSSPAPGILLFDMLKKRESTLDKNFIIKMLEWFKWQHLESRRLFPEITNKYFICMGSTTWDRADLSPTNIMYDVTTKQFTFIDFELFKSWNDHWFDKDRYVSFVFAGIIHLLDLIRQTNYHKMHYNMFKFASNREYPNLLNYCIEYIYEEIV